MDSEKIYHSVQEHYGSIAREKDITNSSAIANAFGYSEEELNTIPKDANLGLSCGNPLAIASIREGEIIIDLGSGAGFDIFLAAKQVGLQGQAIGVDMNEDMLALARKNHAEAGGAANIRFIKANITSVPLEDGIADCIISNCVINLVPEPAKPAAFMEMARMLKPGGRLALADTLARKPMSDEVKESIALYLGCVSGASTQESYMRYLKDAGFKDILIVDTENDLNVYVNAAKQEGVDNGDCCGLVAKGCGFTKEQNGDCCVEPKRDNHSSKNDDKARTCDSGTLNSSMPLSKSSTNCDSPTCCRNQDGKSQDLSLSNIDVNEWAGSFKIFAVKM